MSSRVGIWFAALAVAVASGATVPESLFPGARPVILGVTLILIGVIGELLHPRLTRHTAPPQATPRDTRAADGRVDLASVTGVCRDPNPIDNRFGCFRARNGKIRDESCASTSGDDRSPPLLGRAVVVSLFVGRDGVAWTAQEIADAHAAILRAGVWFEREAMRYGAAINIELADTYFVFDDESADDIAIEFGSGGEEEGPFERGGTTKALVTATRAAAMLGFRDAEDLLRTVAESVGADATVLLMHPRREGRSFAVPLEWSTIPGVSLAVCYARESSFPERLAGPPRTDPVTIVHELLHLFGATDKYGQSLKDFPPRSVTSRDVMRLNETRLSRLRIDPGTAVEIGWLDGPESLIDK